MHPHTSRQPHKAQGATVERERRPTTAKHPLPILHPKDARAHAAASVCEELPSRLHSEPDPPTYEEHQELHSFLEHLDGRNSPPSLESGFANRSGLVELPSSTAPASYPEESAKTHTEDERPLEVCCPSFFTIAGRCECNHHFAKETYCGREWCPTCRESGSPAHQRRKARWFPKLQQLRQVGYLVVTVPPEIRDRYRTKKVLGKVGTSIKRLLDRQGLSRGLRRWHWFGDQVGVQVPEYHPHLNCLVDHGFLEERRLEGIRRGLARILGVGVERINLHYEYSSEVPQILHWVKYVTRPTFLDWRWDEGLARELMGFRNCSTWGRWDGEAVWQVPSGPEGESCEELRQVADLEESRCPFDGTPVTWKGFLLRDKLTHPTERRWYRIGGGYWTKGAG